MTRDETQEALLREMDRKNHWAWPFFSGPDATLAQLRVHFAQEYAVYVRDFPALLARILGKCPPADVRRALAENLYEEETGALSQSGPHPELFVEMLDGIGITRAELEGAELLPASLGYRAFLDHVTLNGSWLEAAAVVTLFVEGSVHERAEVTGTRSAEAPRQRDVEEVLATHWLVRYHGLPPERLRLQRAHHAIEGSHRVAAWSMLLGHAHETREREAIVRVVRQALALWLAYRDGVADACGVRRVA